MGTITEAEARKLGLKPVTESDRATASVETTSGKLTFQAWCEREAARFHEAGRQPQLVKASKGMGKVALWALPLAGVVVVEEG